MHAALEDIPKKIVSVARGALCQAVHHAVFHDPGNEYWEQICILNAAHAGELFIKAIVANEHPLLIFREIFPVDDKQSPELDIRRLIERGRTHDFKDLPALLWLTTGTRLPDMSSFEKIMKARNAIQHFCAPDGQDLRGLALEFIFKNIDPLIASNFGLFAIEHHEDHSMGCHYVVEGVVAHELEFSVPGDDFDVGLKDILEMLDGSSDEYRSAMHRRLVAAGYSIDQV